MKGVWFMPPVDVAQRLARDVARVLEKNGVEGADVQIKFNRKGQCVIGVILPEWFNKETKQ